jgi:hypothetical protein
MPRVYRVHCPNCPHSQVYRSQRNKWWECLMVLVGLRPYRCIACQTRFWSSITFE